MPNLREFPGDLKSHQQVSKEQPLDLSGSPYRLMNATAVEGLHRSLSSTGVVKLDKPIVVAFAIELKRESEKKKKKFFFFYIL